jgi:hypothetical protein
VLAKLFAHGGVDHSLFALEQNVISAHVDAGHEANWHLFIFGALLGSRLIAFGVWANPNIGFV